MRVHIARAIERQGEAAVELSPSGRYGPVRAANMCGIFGAIRLTPGSTEPLVPIVRSGTELLAHRGPDGSGVVTTPEVCFGHRRLSIIDLETGQQPMWSADRSGLIVYNGEVYNFGELRTSLTARGRELATHSDTEAVLLACLEHGVAGIAQLRGMFAFAVLDKARSRALVARDRLGIKPLYWLEKDGALYFSSELEPLYRALGPFPIDLDALDEYLAWQYVRAPRTIYRGVSCLPPGHALDIDLKRGTVSVERYWKLDFKEDRTLSVADWDVKVEEAIDDAVKVSLVSDVPFGAFLSGGVDSSLVVSAMAKIMDRPVETFSIGFREADYSELEYARQVAEISKTHHHSEIVDAQSLELLPMLVRHYGQPFADSSAIPTYHVSKMARRHVKMVLSGDGGDESFAGYHSYEHILRQLDPLRPPTPLGKRRRVKRVGSYLFKRLSGRLVDEAYKLHCGTAHHFAPDDRRALWRPEHRSHVEAWSASRRSAMDIGDDAPILSRLQALDLAEYLPYDVLTKVDVAAMAASLEVRVPLLDHLLVEAVATMPAAYKLESDPWSRVVHMEKKAPLKRLMRKRFPASLVDRPKMGFGVPVGRWMAGEQRAEVEARLFGSDTLARYFDTGVVRTIWDQHLAGNDASAKLWNLVFLEEWMRTHEAALT